MQSHRLSDALKMLAALVHFLGLRLEDYSREREPLLPGELEILRGRLDCGPGDPWSVWLYRVRGLSQAPLRALSHMTESSANGVELCAVLYPRFVQLEQCHSIVLDDLDPTVSEFRMQWSYTRDALALVSEAWSAQPSAHKEDGSTGEVDWSVWEYRGPAWIGMAGYLHERLRQLETWIDFSRTTPSVCTIRDAMRSARNLLHGEDLEESIEELSEDLEERGDSVAAFLVFIDRRFKALGELIELEKYADPDTIRSMLTMFRNSKRSPISYIAHDIELVRLLSRHFLVAEPQLLEWFPSFEETLSMVVQGMLHKSD